MSTPTYHVHAEWDPDAEVYVATSGDIPGLATEAPSMEALRLKLEVLIPELLEANGSLPKGDEGIEIPYELVSQLKGTISVPAQ